MLGSHNHSHDHSHSTPANLSAAFILSIILNLTFVVVEIGYGLNINSVALIADATHNFGDVIGLVLGLVALKLSVKLPSKRFTYGFKSSTILSTLLSGSLLLIAISGILWESVQRIIHPESVNGFVVIIVATIGVIINAVSAYLLSKGNKDLNIKSIFLHLLSDTLVSVGVVIAGIVVLTTGFLYTDPIVSVVIALVILLSTYKLFREAINLSLQGVPSDIDIQKVKEMLSNLPNVLEVHDLHIWAMSTSENALTCHLVIADKIILVDLTKISHDLEHDFNIVHPTIQIETISEKEACKLMPDTVI